MRSLLVALAASLLVVAPVAARPEAILGSQFADAYAAFAPLGELYRSFGDHLFVGTPIVIPRGLGSSCEVCASALNTLQEELVLYVAGDAGAALGAVVRLRVDAEALCAAFGADLALLAALSGGAETVSEEDEARLAAAGFFAEIHSLDLGFGEPLDAALESADGEPRWAMALGFTLRALLLGADPIRLPEEAELVTLFCGSESGTGPRFPVPASIEVAMALLVAAVGRELTDEEAADVRRSAEEIYEYFVTS